MLEGAVERGEIDLGGSESRNGSVETYYSYDPGDGPFFISPERYEELFGSAISNHTHVRYDGTTYWVDSSLFLPENRHTVTRVEMNGVDGSAISFDDLSSHHSAPFERGSPTRRSEFAVDGCSRTRARTP